MYYSRFIIALFVLAACSSDPDLVHPDGPDASDPSNGTDTGPTTSDSGPGGGSDSGPSTTDAGDDPEDAGDEEDVPPPVPLAECDEVVEGVNVIEIDGKERRFWVDSPAGNGPNAAVFWFHGFSGPRSPEEDATSDRNSLDTIGLTPDADPNFPFVRVLLEDLNLQPIQGLDWDIRTEDPNQDIVLFDTVLGCLKAHRNVTDDRVFAAGFSAGATFVNLLHSVRSDVVRAIVTASGLWVNEQRNFEIAERVTIVPGLVGWDWPELDAVQPEHATILLTHGGASDNVPGNPLVSDANLTEAALAATDWLVEHDRLVIDCEHDRGHALHPAIGGAEMIEFFAAHVGAGASPWAEGHPSLPASCRIHRP